MFLNFPVWESPPCLALFPYDHAPTTPSYRRDRTGTGRTPPLGRSATPPQLTTAAQAATPLASPPFLPRLSHSSIGHMSLVLPYPQHQQYHTAPMATDEDDLLALLGSDAFSLESSRDRDLLLLSSLLQTSLPPGSSPPHAGGAFVTSPGAGNYSSNSGPSWSSAGSTSGWGSMGGRGEDNAYASTSSKPFDFSGGSGSGATQHTATPHGTPLLDTCALPPASPLDDFTLRDGSIDWSRRGGRVAADGSSNFGAGTWGTTSGVSPSFGSGGGGGAGLRAPAVSRERGGDGRKRNPSVEEGLPTYQQSFSAGFGWAQREEDDDDMMIEEDEASGVDTFLAGVEVAQRPWSYQL